MSRACLNRCSARPRIRTSQPHPMRMHKAMTGKENQKRCLMIVSLSSLTSIENLIEGKSQVYEAGDYAAVMSRLTWRADLQRTPLAMAQTKAGRRRIPFGRSEVCLRDPSGPWLGHHRRTGDGC